jgi:penicillin-binding protein 2
MLAGGKAVLMAVLGGRLYYLQHVEAERYVTLAEDNRINLRLIAPVRGRIFDRYGHLLAGNSQDYRVLVVAEQTPDVETTLDALGRIVPIPEDERRRVLKETRWKRKFVPVTVVENLTWDDVARIEVNTLQLPGLSIEDGLSRTYPLGAPLSHVLGYVAPVAPGDAEGDPLLELPGFRVGKAGVEKRYDLELRGRGGRSQVEVNAVGRIIRELERQEGRPGDDLTLTVIGGLQQMIYDRFEGESGAAAVMDVASGEVLALVSKPGYDPNAFARGLTVAEWNALIGDSRAPLINKAIGGQYAPGSTFKMAVALAGLSQGQITPRTKVTCRGSIRLGTSEFHCWRRGGHGTLDLSAAIAQSCDVYFYETARRVGVDAISVMAHSLGLGQPLGIELPGERPGLLPTRAWKRTALGVGWQKGETLITGIGQGYVLSTPLQLAVMTARIANGAVAVTPTLVRWRTTANGRANAPDRRFFALDLNREHLHAIQEGMVAVVNGAGGTARAAAIAEPGFAMAGKTGTSQVRRITKAERATRIKKNEELPWEQRDHALFVGYAPVNAPRYAVAVIVEHGGGGAKVAAPIARDILMAAQGLLAVPARPVASPIERHRPGVGSLTAANSGRAPAP